MMSRDLTTLAETGDVTCVDTQQTPTEDGEFVKHCIIIIIARSKNVYDLYLNLLFGDFKLKFLKARLPSNRYSSRMLTVTISCQVTLEKQTTAISK